MNAMVKNATLSEENVPLALFTQSIDFSGLYDHINSFAGINCKFQQPGITSERSGRLYIDIQSDDIKYQTGPFGKILKNCRIQSGSSEIFRDKDTGDPKLWVVIMIRYEHKDGGSNGMKVCHAWYTDSKGWIFKDTGKREG